MKQKARGNSKRRNIHLHKSRTNDIRECDKQKGSSRHESPKKKEELNVIVERKDSYEEPLITMILEGKENKA